MATTAKTKKSKRVTGEFETSVGWECGCFSVFKTLGYRPDLNEIRKQDKCKHCEMVELMGSKYGVII